MSENLKRFGPFIIDYFKYPLKEDARYKNEYEYTLAIKLFKSFYLEFSFMTDYCCRNKVFLSLTDFWRLYIDISINYRAVGFGIVDRGTAYYDENK